MNPLHSTPAASLVSRSGTGNRKVGGSTPPLVTSTSTSHRWVLRIRRVRLTDSAHPWWRTCRLVPPRVDRRHFAEIGPNLGGYVLENEQLSRRTAGQEHSVTHPGTIPNETITTGGCRGTPTVISRREDRNLNQCDGFRAYDVIAAQRDAHSRVHRGRRGVPAPPSRSPEGC